LPLQAAAPAWKSELTSPARGPLPNPAPASIELELSWKGMLRAGVVTIDFAPRDVRKPGIYCVRASSASLGAAALFHPYRSDFWTEMHSKTLIPRYAHAVETEPEEITDTTVRYHSNRAEVMEIVKTIKTGATRKSTRVFREPAVFDIFSAMLHVRSQPLAAGDEIRIVVMPFTTPYLLKVRVAAREVHNGRKAIRLNVGMRKIDRDTLELKPYKKLKKDITLWLGDDADRMPLEIRAPAFIGDVRAVLVKHRKL
jgi:hypothetical protein